MKANTTEIAKVCYEVNRAICEANRDYSQPRWEFARNWQKKPMVQKIKEIQADPDASPEGIHNAWCREQYQGGWVYGEAYDAMEKVNPNLIRYAELSLHRRIKETAVHAIIKAMVEL